MCTYFHDDVLFIGTRFSNLYTAVDTPDRGRVVSLFQGWRFFVKVRAHRGDPYNEAADRIASTATRYEDVPLLWNAPSGRIIYQFTPDPCELEDTLYTASLNDTVKKFIKNHAALSTLYPSRSSGVTESFSDALTAAEIFWLSVCLARHSRRKLRNDSCNRLASNFPVGLSSTNGARRTLPIAPPAASENPWDMSRAAARSWKSLA